MVGVGGGRGWGLTFAGGELPGEGGVDEGEELGEHVAGGGVQAGDGGDGVLG